MRRPSSLLLASLVALAAAPARGAPAVPDVQSVYRLANSARDDLRCASVAFGEPIPADNFATARDYANVAGMYAFAARNYPELKDADARTYQINSLLIDAAGAYRSAYACAPIEQNATYLYSGIELLGERVRHLVNVEKHAADSELVAPLRKQIEELREAIPPTQQCPVCPKCPPCDQRPPEPASGYRGLYAGRLHMSVGLGIGRASLAGDEAGTLTVFTFRAALGPRFVLGKRRRHALATGLDYALHNAFRYRGALDEDVESPSAWHQAGPFLDWGFAPHRHFALHLRAAVHVIAGLLTFGDVRPSDSFHAISVGGGGGVCTAGSALCLRAFAYGTPSVGPGDRPDLTSAYDFTLNLDIFRVVDNVLARRDRRSGAGR